MNYLKKAASIALVLSVFVPALAFAQTPSANTASKNATHLARPVKHLKLKWTKSKTGVSAKKTKGKLKPIAWPKTGAKSSSVKKPVAAKSPAHLSFKDISKL